MCKLVKKYDLSIISQQNKLKLQNYIITELIVIISLLNNDHKLQKLSSGSVSTDADNDNDNAGQQRLQHRQITIV